MIGLPAVHAKRETDRTRPVLDNNVVQRTYHGAAYRSGHYGRLHPNAAAVHAVPKLPAGLGLILALVLSLGLWGLVWLAGSAVVAAWPW